MIFKSAILILACSLYYSNAKSSREVLNQHLKNEAKDIEMADAGAKDTVTKIPAYPENLLATVVSEFDSMDECGSKFKDNKCSQGVRYGCTYWGKRCWRETKEDHCMVKSYDGRNVTCKNDADCLAKNVAKLQCVGEELLVQDLEGCCNKLDCSDYKGRMDKTINGIKCQAWNSSQPHVPYYKWKGSGEENYCRNPSGHKTAWCYTMDPKKRWQNCGIYQCWQLATVTAQKTEIQWLQKELDQTKEILKGAKQTIGEKETAYRRCMAKLEGGYEKVNGQYVKYFDLKMTWESAKEYCESSSTQLITVKDKKTTEWLKGHYKTIWIGASDLGNEGHWTWVNGTQVEDGNWNAGEPDNGKGLIAENCAVINSQFFPWWVYGKWSDRPCILKERFACEIPN